MANKWQDVIVQLVRLILQDVGTSPTYDDGRLEDVAIGAAHLVLSEITFNYTYSINLVAGTITPDPVDNSDTSFINMVSYKAALMILNSELKTAASKGLLVKDGPSILDTRQFFTSQKSRYELMLKEYDKVKLAIKMGDLNAGVAILSPYTTNDPTYIWR